MDKNIFYNELKDILEIEDETLNDESEIHLTSLSTLSIMAFIYENFEKQVKASDLRNIGCVKDLMNLIGNESLI
jgi:acyl carrier protein